MRIVQLPNPQNRTNRDKYYQYRFDFQNPATNAVIYYGYSSDGTYHELTSEPFYFKKIDTYTNNGNDGIEIR